MDLTSLTAQRFDIGKAAIFAYSEDAGVTYKEWDPAADLFPAMYHIGTTEGPVEIAANDEYSTLTIEDTGPAILKRYLSGENPSFEMGVFPNPDNMQAFSPTGTASAGFQRRPMVKTQTLWIVPEQLFIDYTNGVPSEVAVTFDSTTTVFLKDASALTVAEQELADMSILIWKAQFGRLTPRYSPEDGGKSLKNVPVTVLQDFDKPNGAQLYLALSELADFPTLDLAPVA